jgi:hypothetical protein
MRNVALNFFIGIVITAATVLGADNSLGTWKRNIEKSTATPPVSNPITSLTLVREGLDGGVKQTATGKRKDGTPINGAFTAKYDGKEYPVTGTTWDTTALKQIDANTFTVENKKTGGKYHTTSRTVISKDGKTMTVTGKGTNEDGKPYTFTFIYEKQ